MDHRLRQLELAAVCVELVSQIINVLLRLRGRVLHLAQALAFGLGDRFVNSLLGLVENLLRFKFLVQPRDLSVEQAEHGHQRLLFFGPGLVKRLQFVLNFVDTRGERLLEIVDEARHGILHLLLERDGDTCCVAISPVDLFA